MIPALVAIAMFAPSLAWSKWVPVVDGRETLEAAMPWPTGDCSTSVGDGGELIEALRVQSELYDQITAIDRRYTVEKHLSGLREFLQHPPRRTTEEPIPRLVQLMLTMAEELRGLATPRLPTVWREALEHAAQALETIRTLGEKYARNPERFEQVSSRTWSAQARLDSPEAVMTQGYFANLRGPIGELRVALRVPSLLGMNWRAHQFIEYVVGQDPRLESTKQWLRERSPSDREIDIVAEGGRTLGEVKNRHSVLAYGDASFHQLESGARYWTRLVADLNKQPAVLARLGGPIRYHVYLPEGVDERAADALVREHGVDAVIGPRFRRRPN